MGSAFTTYEIMVATAARMLRDTEVVFVGIGIPNVAVNLARRTRCPNLVLIYESGAIGAQPARLPISIGDPALVTGAAGVCSMPELFHYYLQRGVTDVGFLGGAQIDQYGNLNSSFIGDPDHPKVRLPGTGGANDIASLASKILIAMHHEKKRFVEKVDFITTPGYLHGGDSREKAGLIAGGIHKVITHLGFFGFDPKTRRMKLESLHPGATVEEVCDKTGFDLIVPDNVPCTQPPTAEELRILRQLDPDQKYTRAKEE